MAAIDDLFAELRGWINREDIEDSVMETWVRASEERFNLKLRHRDMIVKVDLPFVTEGFVLPADYLDRRSVRYKVNSASAYPEVRRGRPLDYVTTEEYWDRKSDAYTKIGPTYTVDGYDLYASNSTAGTVLSVSYYQRIPPLSAANWVWTNFKHLYVFASLAESEAYLEGDERFALWATKATELIEGMNETSRAGQYGDAMLKKRFRSFG